MLRAAPLTPLVGAAAAEGVDVDVGDLEALATVVLRRLMKTRGMKTTRAMSHVRVIRCVPVVSPAFPAPACPPCYAADAPHFARRAARSAPVAPGGARLSPIHSCGIAAECVYCRGLTFPDERGKCCHKGTHVLDAIDNPRLGSEERAMLHAPHLSHCSRVINSALSFAVIGTTPTAAHGGRGIRCKKYPGVYTLHGRTYHMWVPPGDAGPARGHTLPDVLLLDRVDSVTRKPHGLALLKSWRLYLRERHPLARTLAHVGDVNVPGRGRVRPLAVSVAPGSAASSNMEIAFVYPDSPAGPPALCGTVFPLRSVPGAEYNKTFVPDTSALFDVMRFPLKHSDGRGGFNQPPTTSRSERDGSVRASSARRISRARPTPSSREGHPFTLFQWTKANLYQCPRLHALARLMQEWVLTQFSRWQHDHIEFLRHRARTAFMAPMHAVRAGVDAINDARRRVYLSSKFVGCKRYLAGKVADGMAIVQVCSGAGRCGVRGCNR